MLFLVSSTCSLFVWLVLVVNDRKFSAGTVFFSHTKLASNTYSRTSNDTNQPTEQAVRYVYKQDAYHMYLAIIVVSRLGQTRESRRCKEMGKKEVRHRYLRKIVFLYYPAGLHKEI